MTHSFSPGAQAQYDDLVRILDLAPAPVEATDCLNALLAAHRDLVLAGAAGRLDRLADEVESRVAAHYGAASGLGPGSADMLREAADVVRSHSAGTTVTTEEVLRTRLWLIDRALRPIDAQQDPAGIVGAVGPYLDGPIHPAQIAEYRSTHCRPAHVTPTPHSAQSRDTGVPE
ncbi:hypothetical protein ACFV4P_34450 [Kitasatospora sp. NPDC059795]|uniref:hypothetical protein n=1 Tax=Kitasatospora sp. NPDC059795 TaxID=3346949 RepID=UPI00364A3941